jgi:hypothetical protein
VEFFALPTFESNYVSQAFFVPYNLYAPQEFILPHYATDENHPEAFYNCSSSKQILKLCVRVLEIFSS